MNSNFIKYNEYLFNLIFQNNKRVFLHSRLFIKNIVADWIDTICAIIPYDQSDNFIRKFTMFSKIVRFLFRKIRDLYQIQFNYSILVGKSAAVTISNRHYQLLLTFYQIWAKLAFQMDIIYNMIDLT